MANGLSLNECQARIRVMLAEDHPILRMAIARVLGEHADIEVVGQAANGEEAIDVALRLRPDVVLMDVAMPRINGTEATRRILETLPGTRVIGLSMHSDAVMAAAMHEAGAVGYICKDAPPDDLIAIILAHAADASEAFPNDRGTFPR
jgi:DNA-binding NarL/FixJ family response regulator